MTEPGPRVPRPATLTAAAGVVGLQAVALIGFGLLEVDHTSAGNNGVALTTAAFFVLVGAGLGAAGRGLLQVRSWARGPVVAAELIELLTAYSFLGGGTTVVAVLLAVVAVVALGLLLHPDSTRALAADPG